MRAISTLPSAVFARASVKYPRVLARITNQYPLRSISELYTEVPPSDHEIPNIVHQTWIEPRLGRSHAAALAAFRDRNRDFSFRFYSEDDMERFMMSSYPDHPIYPIFRAAKFGPMRADIFRYCLLYEVGGVYCDIGKALSAPIAQFMAPGRLGVIAKESHKGGAPGRSNEQLIVNWALMFAPKHPMLRRTIDGIVTKAHNFWNVPVLNPKHAILEFTGPAHLADTVRESVVNGEMDGVEIAGVDFGGAGILNLPGSYVRYARRSAYILAKDEVILDGAQSRP